MEISYLEDNPVRILSNRSLMERAQDIGATIDGEPATISGAMRRFARVSALADPGRSATFSWFAVSRILDKGGEFHT